MLVQGKRQEQNHLLLQIESLCIIVFTINGQDMVIQAEMVDK